MSSPTQRTLATLRELGYVAQVVEHWNPHARIRQDLYGCIDVLAIHPDHGMLGVQACAGSSASKRAGKAQMEPRLEVFLAAGARFEVWAWAKRGDRGKRKLWTVRRLRAQLESERMPAVAFVELSTEDMR